jgi:hypothetical protein
MKSLLRHLLTGRGVLLGLLGCRVARVPMPVLELPTAAQQTKLIGEDRTLVREGCHDWKTGSRLIAEITRDGRFFFGGLR